MSREIAGYEVYDGFDEMMNAGTAYDKNYVKLRNVSLSEAQLNDLIDGNGGYVKMNKSEALKKARRYQMMAQRYAMLARRADVKDDEGDHDDHEYMHLDHYGDEWIVESTGGIKRKFDNEKDAVDYELSLHDHSDEKVEKEEARRRRAIAMMRRRKMMVSKASKAVIPASKRIASIQVPRISSAPATVDPSLKGLIR